MLYALICTDDPENGLENRKKARREHLEYLKSLGDRMVMAGPFVTEDGKQPTGSLIILETASRDEAEEISRNDPYARAGVFSRVEIRPWNWLFGRPPAE